MEKKKGAKTIRYIILHLFMIKYYFIAYNTIPVPM